MLLDASVTPDETPHRCARGRAGRADRGDDGRSRGAKPPRSSRATATSAARWNARWATSSPTRCSIGWPTRASRSPCANGGRSARLDRRGRGHDGRGVFTVLPFQNTLANLPADRRGRAGRARERRQPGRRGRGPLPARSRASAFGVGTPRAEPGSRVVSAEVDMGGTWEALDPEATYGVGVQQLHAQRRRRLFRLSHGTR